MLYCEGSVAAGQGASPPIPGKEENRKILSYRLEICPENYVLEYGEFYQKNVVGLP